MYSDEIVCPITKWARKNPIEETMYWAKPASKQLCFVRDDLSSCLASSQEERTGIQFQTEIIGEHTSKSIKLPVYELNYRDCKFIMRNNFYDWKISICLSYKIPCLYSDDFVGLFNPATTIKSIYCEGFNERDVYQSFNDYVKEMMKGKTFPDRKFTIEIQTNQELYTFFYVLNTQYLRQV